MTTIDEFIRELETLNRISAIETGISALNTRIANHKTSPEYLARMLSVSPRLMCPITGETRIAYLPNAQVWISIEHGEWRTRSHKEIAELFRIVLAQDGRTITGTIAKQIERAARTQFARAEVPGGAA